MCEDIFLFKRLSVMCVWLQPRHYRVVSTLFAVIFVFFILITATYINMTVLWALLAAALDPSKYLVKGTMAATALGTATTTLASMKKAAVAIEDAMKEMQQTILRTSLCAVVKSSYVRNAMNEYVLVL